MRLKATLDGAKNPEMTLDDFKAMFRAVCDPRPMTEEEVRAAKAGFDKMSPWQTMSMDELNNAIAEEERARALQEKKNDL